MAVRVSTGYANRILGPQSFEAIFRDGVIEVRGGVQPASADAGVAGTPLLGRISPAGTTFVPGAEVGLRFVRSGRMILKDPAQQWTLDGLATGSATWFRWLPNTADGGEASISAPRIDGAIGLVDDVGDFQMRMTNRAISASSLVLIPQWIYAIPPLGE